MTNSRVVHVHIQGQAYAVRSELDPGYVCELAAYVDEKMRLAGREIASADTVRVSVIAALNIADELFRARTERQTSDERDRRTGADANERIEKIERLIDAALVLRPEPDEQSGSTRTAVNG